MDAVFLLSKFLKTKTNRFSYAGTKDTRGVTTQLVTAKQISAKQLASLNPRLRGIHLGDFQYVKEQINLGQLKGNHFQVVLRDIDAPDATVDAVMQSVKSKGFINYYGMQRFGTGTVATSEIGKAILLGNWSGAVDLILGERVADYEEVKAARRCWTQTKDARKAGDLFPQKCTIERQLLQGLKSNKVQGKADGYDWVSAFRSISRNMRLMYVHAYQSLLWNKLVSARIKQHGLEVVAGDLILADKDDARASCHPDDEQKIRVLVVTAADVAAGTFKITDVVMPLPGYAVVLPSNELGDYLRQLMTEDGLAGYDFRHKEKDYTLSGAYRHMCVLPSDVSWKVHDYTDEKKSLVLSDADFLEGKTELTPQVAAEGKVARRALALAFTLPPSTYATMLVREVIKMPTDSNYQTSLNPKGKGGQTSTAHNDGGGGAAAAAAAVAPQPEPEKAQAN